MEIAHDYLIRSIKLGIEEKSIAFFDHKEGLNHQVFKKIKDLNQDSVTEKRTYYLSFHKTKNNSKKKIKFVLGRLCARHEISFLCGQCYHYGPEQSQKIIAYAFGNKDKIFHFILSEDFSSVKNLSERHQEVDFWQSGYSQEKNLASR
jgi:hypothetical protein